MADLFVRSLQLKRDEVESFESYPFSMPAIRQLSELPLDTQVTLFAGENGSEHLAAAHQSLIRTAASRYTSNRMESRFCR